MEWSQPNKLALTDGFKRKLKSNPYSVQKSAKDQYPVPLKSVRIYILKTTAGRRAGRERSLGPFVDFLAQLSTEQPETGRRALPR